ncbi:phage major capsid protein [Microbulbifer thermotolerans]|uniref:Phage major capsid protein n=1 Tax=Microbulbifer thermotolerans TaxID=252514 RepID=A0AB35HXS4_MICTH|nr:phage major capsid protein [Microbulbifer thermotolerans]MCX2802254.1 phage major capsid protein [Microbulbifer thermotolerans]
MTNERLGELIRQINEKGSRREALFSFPAKAGVRSDGEESSPIDVEKRTVDVAFASETEAVERWYGIEVLICTPEAVDLSALNNRAPVLDMHDPLVQVGVVEGARVDGDRVARATLRYSRSQKGDEIFQDIVDNIRSKISVGYRILEMELAEERENGPDIYHVTKWQPYEISNVSIPADDAVGVGRSAATMGQAHNPKESNDENAGGGARSAEPTVSDSPATPKTEIREANTMDPKELEAQREAARKQGGVDEAQRVSEILDVADQYNAPRELVDSHLRDSSKTKHDLAAALLEARAKETGANAEAPEIGMSEKEVREFSFLRLFRSMAFPDNSQFRKEAAFELECSQAASEKFKGERHGSELIPHDVLIASRAMDLSALRRAGFDTRALTATLADTGSALVGTQHMAASFIDLLRNRLVLSSLGAMTLTGLNGNLAIPRQVGGATMYWLDPENSNIPSEGLPVFDQVSLSPKNAAAYTEMSRQLLLQSSPDVENLVRMDLAKQMALGLDRAAFYGTGADGQPRGVINMTGINTVDFSGANPTFAEVVDMETEVALDNADEGSAAYVMGAGLRGYFKTTEKFSGSNGATIWEPGNLVNGYRTVVSNQIDAGDLLFGNFSDVIIGMWGGLDMLVNPYSGDRAGTVRITAHQSCDVTGRHPESFCHGKNFTP